MDTKLKDTAYELERSLSDAITLAEGTLQLMDDAAGHYERDMRYQAYRSLVEQIRTQAANAADAFGAVEIALHKQL